MLARTGIKLRGHCYVYTGHQLNQTASSTDPSGHNQSPCLQWPQAPFYHARQEFYPWGCLVHGFVGKRSENPSSGARAYPGIFVGHADDTSGYLVYHEDTDTVITYGYVNAFPNVFPCAERMMSGEHPATLVSGEWRQWAEFRPTEVAHGPFSEYVTEKQLEVRLPQTMYPTFPGEWKAVCQRPITLRNKIVCMRMIFTGYTGDRSKLSKKDKECLTPGSDLWLDIPISETKSTSLTKGIDGTVCLRDLLTSTYPGATLMHT